MLDWSSSVSSLGDTLVLAVLEQEERLRAVQERDALRRDGNDLADMQPVKAVFQLAHLTYKAVRINPTMPGTVDDDKLLSGDAPNSAASYIFQAQADSTAVMA